MMSRSYVDAVVLSHSLICSYGHTCQMLLADGSADAHFVPSLSAVQLYKRGESSPAYQFFERALPHERLPFMQKIFGLSHQYAGIVDTRISELDHTKSWFAIWWQPILYDHHTSASFSGSFLIYHSLSQLTSCPLPKLRFPVFPAVPSEEGNPITTDSTVELPEPVPSPDASAVTSTASEVIEIQSTSENSVSADPLADASSASTSEADVSSSSTITEEPPAIQTLKLDHTASEFQPEDRSSEINPECACGFHHHSTPELMSPVELAWQSSRNELFLPVIGLVAHRVAYSSWFFDYECFVPSPALVDRLGTADVELPICSPLTKYSHIDISEPLGSLLMTAHWDLALLQRR